MNDRERITSAERAESAGDYLAAEAGFREVAASPHELLSAEANFHLGRVWWRQGRFEAALRGAREVGHEPMKDIPPKRSMLLCGFCKNPRQ